MDIILFHINSLTKLDLHYDCIIYAAINTPNFLKLQTWIDKVASKLSNSCLCYSKPK